MAGAPHVLRAAKHTFIVAIIVAIVLGSLSLASMETGLCKPWPCIP
jgi:hypothetical protein